MLLSNLVRVLLAVDRQTQASRCFAFLEFPTVEAAEDALYKGSRLTGCAGIASLPLALSFGRDLYVLNRYRGGWSSPLTVRSLFLKGSAPGQMLHWDPLLELVVFPAARLGAGEEEPAPSVQGRVVGAPEVQAARTVAYKREISPAFGAPIKKKKMQFKKWETKSDELSCIPAATDESDPAESPAVPAKPSDRLADRLDALLDPILAACLLCQRRFGSLDGLSRHGKESVLHRENVRAYLELASAGTGAWDRSDERAFRDRAAERRDASGGEPPERARALPAALPQSVGAKLLQKFGWREGQGLGPQGQGIIEPIKVHTPGRC